MINYACQFLNCENTLAVSALISGAVVTETAKSFLTSIPDEEGTYWRIILSANRPEYKTLIYKQTRVDPVSSKTAYDCFSVCKNFWKVTGGGNKDAPHGLGSRLLLITSTQNGRKPKEIFITSSVFELMSLREMGQNQQQQLPCCYCCSYNQLSEVSIILA